MTTLVRVYRLFPAAALILLLGLVACTADGPPALETGLSFEPGNAPQQTVPVTGTLPITPTLPVTPTEPITPTVPITDTVVGDDTQVIICHYPPGNPANAQTITVGATAVEGFLNRGATLGPCDNDDGEDGDDADEPEVEREQVTICHYPPGNPANAQTITVGAPAVEGFLNRGATLGPCDNEDGEDGDDADEPEGEGEQVTICHYPPGNPANAKTITVGATAVEGFLNRGATLGECPANGGEGANNNRGPGNNPGQGNQGNRGQGQGNQGQGQGNSGNSGQGGGRP